MSLRFPVRCPVCGRIRSFRWLQDPRVELADEPPELDPAFDKGLPTKARSADGGCAEGMDKPR